MRMIDSSGSRRISRTACSQATSRSALICFANGGAEPGHGQRPPRADVLAWPGSYCSFLSAAGPAPIVEVCGGENSFVTLLIRPGLRWRRRLFLGPEHRRSPLPLVG